jgi:hypothetical protein
MTESAAERTGEKAQSKEEQVNPVGSTSGTAAGSEQNEQAFLQVLMQRFGEAKAGGIPLPDSVAPIVTLVTTSQEGQPVQSTSTQPPVQVSPTDIEMTEETKKRKAEGAPQPATEPETKVARKDVQAEPAKLTVEKLSNMTAAQIEDLDPGQLTHIEMNQLLKAPREVRDAVRLLKNPSAQKQKAEQKEKKQQRGSDLAAFSAVKGNIELTGSWNKHYGGTEKGDAEFTAFLDRKGYTTRRLIEMVIGSSGVAQHCRFEEPARAQQICQFTIDLYGFFDDRQMQDMTIGGSVTKDSLEVFHAGRRR